MLLCCCGSSSMLCISGGISGSDQSFIRNLVLHCHKQAKLTDELSALQDLSVGMCPPFMGSMSGQGLAESI